MALGRSGWISWRPARATCNRAVFVGTRRAEWVHYAAAAPVAQLDRASGFEPEGREFESLRARHLP